MELFLLEDEISPTTSEVKFEIQTKLKSHELEQFVEKPARQPEERSRKSIYKTLNNESPKNKASILTPKMVTDYLDKFGAKRIISNESPGK